MSLLDVRAPTAPPAAAPGRRRSREHRPAPTHPSNGAVLSLRAHTGEALPLDPARWHGTATAEEIDLLATLRGPVIDLGCGPGRLVVGLAALGVPALGVDAAPTAVALARGRGAAVLERDVFGPLPGEGRWGSVLLFDGNIGIGGDPHRLLTRCRRLADQRGQVVVEVEGPGTAYRRVTAWLEAGGGRSEPFGWAVVGADAIDELARNAGLRLRSILGTGSGRWFAFLAPAR